MNPLVRARHSAARALVPLAAHDIAVRAAAKSGQPEFPLEHVVTPLETLCRDLDQNPALSPRSRKQAREALVMWLVGTAELSTRSEDHIPHAAISPAETTGGPAETTGPAVTTIFVTGISPEGLQLTTERVRTDLLAHAPRLSAPCPSLLTPRALAPQPRAHRATSTPSPKHAGMPTYEDATNAALMAASFLSLAPEARWHVPTYSELVATSDLRESLTEVWSWARSEAAETGRDCAVLTSMDFLDHIEFLRSLPATAVLLVGASPADRDDRTGDRPFDGLAERIGSVVEQRRASGSDGDPLRISRYLTWRVETMAENAKDRCAENLDAPIFLGSSWSSGSGVADLPEDLAAFVRRGSGKRSPS